MRPPHDHPPGHGARRRSLKPTCASRFQAVALGCAALVAASSTLRTVFAITSLPANITASIDVVADVAVNHAVNPDGPPYAITIDGPNPGPVLRFDQGAVGKVGALSVGANGAGGLEVLTGSTLQSTSVAIGAGASSGVMSVLGRDALWTNSGNVYVGGDSLAPGGSGFLEIDNDSHATVGGSFKVWPTGTFYMHAGSHLTAPSVDLAGLLRTVLHEPAHGPLITLPFGGQLHLAGPLELELRNDDFTPYVGATFHVFDFGGATISGQFSQITVQSQLVWDLSQLYTTGNVRLVKMLPTGDFNADGDVDGDDFLTWQRQYGASISLPGAGADASRDGIVGDADLTAWKSHFAASLIAEAAPEPPALALLLPLAAALLSHCRPRRR